MGRLNLSDVSSHSSATRASNAWMDALFRCLAPGVNCDVWMMGRGRCGQTNPSFLFASSFYVTIDLSVHPHFL